MNVLYVYAVTREAVTPRVDGVDGTRQFGTVSAQDLSAVFTPVGAEAFSQETIDRRAADLEWLGAIGYHHQDVVSDLMRLTAIVPLRAFTLFSSEEALRAYLVEHRQMLAGVLERLGGRREWTLRVEFEPARWSEAVASRVESLRALQKDIENAAPGKAFLLRKKLEDEKKRASRAAEQSVVAEIERLVLETLRCQTIAETRERRDGAFPQINVLLNEGEEGGLQELHEKMSGRYAAEGVTLGLTGPWPPYSFSGGGTVG